ncbi:CBS domain-containing protein [Streptosporangium sp. OZ121]|uniref:CBS domain-containing protein n=1 Tax=Streptosporangium sp. OZ121 TaxID=3444183 RepID=UPI003F7A9FAE
MLARDIMTGPVVTLLPAHSVRWAIRVLFANAITAAPVLDDDGTLVGIVSEMDLLRGEFQPDPRAALRPILGHASPPPLRVEEVMTRQVVTVTPTTDAARLVELLVAKRVKSLPVLRDDRVVGMVSRRDLIRVLARSDEELRADVLAALSEQYPLGPRWEVAVHDGVATLGGHADGHHDRIADLLARTVPGVVRVRHLP